MVGQEGWRNPGVTYQICSLWCTRVFQSIDWEKIYISTKKHSYRDDKWIGLLATLVSDIPSDRFFLVWQILSYRIRGKIWLQCFRAFLQCALYLGDPVPISLLIINPLGNVRILSDNQVVADSAEETRPLLVFAHRDYIPLQVPLWTLTELPCRTRTETVSAWNASVEDLLILSTSFYLLSIISVCQISGRTKK